MKIKLFIANRDQNYEFWHIQKYKFIEFITLKLITKKKENLMKGVSYSEKGLMTFSEQGIVNFDL